MNRSYRLYCRVAAVAFAFITMGGQIATDGALHIDMRRFNRIVEFSPASKTITVQAGATWRQIQEVIDSADRLSESCSRTQTSRSGVRYL